MTTTEIPAAQQGSATLPGQAEAGKAGPARKLVLGCANSGKTARALARVAQLAAAGADPARIMLVCASDAAVAEARRALTASDGALEAVAVTTAPALELKLLSSERAIAFTGRAPRLLTPYERSFVAEDIKTTGLQSRQLKGMLGFFRKSLTELADDDMTSFIIDEDERSVFGTACRALAAMRVIHPCELAGLTVRYLRSLGAEAAEVAGVDHIVADDYQSLSRASQHVLDLLAPASLWAFADKADNTEGADPFPFAAGADEFLDRNAGAAVENLAAPDPAASIAGAAGLLLSSGFLEARSLGVQDSQGAEERVQTYDVPRAASPVPGVTCREVVDADQEFSQVAAYVSKLMADGAAPRDILVATPNRAWEGGLCRALDKAGVAWQRMADGLLTGGDVRDLSRCASARVLTALSLVADPSDGASWRAWCGFGDHLTRSHVFSKLEATCEQEGTGLTQAIGKIAADAQAADEADELTPSMREVAQAYRQGQDLIGHLAGLKGEDLLAAVASELGLSQLPQDLAQACLLAGEDADAASMVAAARGVIGLSGFMGDPQGVRLCPYAKLGAVKAAHLVLLGCMNGWMPPHALFDLSEASFAKREQIDARSRADLYRMAGCATQSLLVSSFERCDLVTAERLDVKEYRIRAGKDGRRVAVCHRSLLIDYALDAWGLDPLDRQAVARQISLQ